MNLIGIPHSEELRGSEPRFFSLQASTSLAQCFQKNEWKMTLQYRHVQMRLLWELQSYFLDRLPADGISPRRHEAIILCLQPLPVVNFKINENDDSELRSATNRDGVCIDMLERARALRTSLFLPHAPHTVLVLVDIQIAGPGKIELNATLLGEGTFNWEDWRNDLSERLTGIQKWQNGNELECAALLRRKETLQAGCDLHSWLHWEPERI